MPRLAAHGRLCLVIAVLALAHGSVPQGRSQDRRPTPIGAPQMSDTEQFALFEKLNADSKMALLFARKAVSEHGGVAVDVDHLAIGLLTVLEASLRPLLAAGTTVSMISSDLVKNIPATTPPSETQEIPMSAAAWGVLERAAQQAVASGLQTASPTILLSVILDGPDVRVRDVLKKAGLTPQVVRQLPVH